MIGMTVLECHSDPFREVDRIHEMKSIAYLVTGYDAFVQSRTIHQKGVVLHTPSVVEIVFTSGSVEARRPFVVVDKNHLIAFSPTSCLGSERSTNCSLHSVPYLRSRGRRSYLSHPSEVRSPLGCSPGVLVPNPDRDFLGANESGNMLLAPEWPSDKVRSRCSIPAGCAAAHEL